jgi:hypothetical protein
VARLTSGERLLCAIYAALGVAALVGTQIALAKHISDGDGDGFAGLGNTVVNPAATFTVIDLLVVAVVGLVFMVVEARRIGLRHVWIYVVLTFAVAISVALPAFLIARQIHLAGDRAATAT